MPAKKNITKAFKADADADADDSLENKWKANSQRSKRDSALGKRVEAPHQPIIPSKRSSSRLVESAMDKEVKDSKVHILYKFV